MRTGRGNATENETLRVRILRRELLNKARTSRVVCEVRNYGRCLSASKTTLSLELLGI